MKNLNLKCLTKFTNQLQILVNNNLYIRYLHSKTINLLMKY